MAIPLEVSVNAWRGSGTVSAAVAKTGDRWALNWQGQPITRLLAPEPSADPGLWTDRRVGWGVILPDNEEVSESERAVAVDAPEPIRRLVRQRGDAPVLRFRKDSPQAFTHLWRYYSDGRAHPIPISGSRRGTETGAIPRYLLIYGSPAEVPWRLQYILNTEFAVGRLQLSGESLERYVSALLDGWAESSAKVERTLVWAVDYGSDDITRLMRLTVADPVHRSLAADSDIGAHGALYLGGQDATIGALVDALADRGPALVVTTSHGMTGPEGAPAPEKLGLPVDKDEALLEVDALLTRWQPDGAVWYSHACCSAGCDAYTIYQGLMEPDSALARMLEELSQLRARVAPLPTALLGAAKPLRAFVGHVEPTFDWTLRHPTTRRGLTESIRRALYDNLYQPDPVGHALRDWYEPIGGLYAQHDAARSAYFQNQDTEGDALFCQLAARDRQSTVLLGDPTATLPKLRPH